MSSDDWHKRSCSRNHKPKNKRNTITSTLNIFLLLFFSWFNNKTTKIQLICKAFAWAPSEWWVCVCVCVPHNGAIERKSEREREREWQRWTITTNKKIVAYASHYNVLSILPFRLEHTNTHKRFISNGFFLSCRHFHTNETYLWMTQSLNIWRNGFWFLALPLWCCWFVQLNDTARNIVQIFKTTLVR